MEQPNLQELSTLGDIQTPGSTSQNLTALTAVLTGLTALKALSTLSGHPSSDENLAMDLGALPKIESDVQALYDINTATSGLLSQAAATPSIIAELLSNSVDLNYLDAIARRVTENQLGHDDLVNTALATIKTPSSEFKIAEGSSTLTDQVSMDSIELARVVSDTELTHFQIPAIGKGAITNNHGDIGVWLGEEVTNIVRSESKIGNKSLKLPLDKIPFLEDSKILPKSPTLTNVAAMVATATQAAKLYKDTLGESTALVRELMRSKDFYRSGKGISDLQAEGMTKLPIKIPSTLTTWQVYMQTGSISFIGSKLLGPPKPLSGVGSNVNRNRNSPANIQKQTHTDTPTPSLVYGVPPMIPIRGLEASSRKVIASALQQRNVDPVFENSPETIKQKGDIIKEAIAAMPKDSLLKSLPCATPAQLETKENLIKTVTESCKQYPLYMVKELLTIQTYMEKFFKNMRLNSKERLLKVQEESKFVEKTQILAFNSKQLVEVEKFIEHLDFHSLDLPEELIGCALPFYQLEQLQDWLKEPGLLKKLNQIKENLEKDKTFLEHRKIRKIVQPSLDNYLKIITILQKPATFYYNITKERYLYKSAGRRC